MGVREKLEFKVLKVILQWALGKSLNLRFSKSCTTVVGRENFEFEVLKSRTKVGVSENLKSEVFKVIYYSEQ